VSVVGQWDKGEMGMIFVGGFGIGSISLTFDTELKTNSSEAHKKEYGLRRDYEAGIKEKSLSLKELNLVDNEVMGHLAKQWEERKKEFVIDDMVNQGIQSERREQKWNKLKEIEGKLNLNLLEKIGYFYSKKDELELEHNLYNGFRSNLERVKERSERYEYEDKAKEAKNFVETTAGIFIKKGVEMGMFNGGSTIVLLFTAPKDLSFNLNVGQKIKIGQAIFPLKVSQ